MLKFSKANTKLKQLENIDELSPYLQNKRIHPQSIVSQKFTSSTAGKRSKMAKIANSVASLLLKK